MDWLGTGMVIVAIGAAFISLWRVHKLKKEVLRFTEQVERGLDDIISGKGFPEGVESEKDTLWGRCSEKLWRVNHIWTKKEEAGVKEKQMMKELISDISHQTRTPIANICLYTQLLEEIKVNGEFGFFLFGFRGCLAGAAYGVSL